MERKKPMLLLISLSVFMMLASCEKIANDTSEANEVESRSMHRASKTFKDGNDIYTNKNTYLKRFAQSWKFYAKANDIAKREKLRKALLDALRSMNSKKKTKMTSLSHDSVKRIRHAAHMLKEFKRMYKLSNDVLSTWKDYNNARKSLIDIGKTKEGGDILKKYVILRDQISDNIKRSEIAHPTIVDDQDIDDNIAKDNIARHGQELQAGNLIVQRAMTPGTLQIIRSPVKHRNSEAHKRMSLFSDAKEAARTAYSKAKEAINTLKARLQEIVSAHKKKTRVARKNGAKETNDKGTNKKSILAENNELKGQSLGHVNSAMALAGMIKKAEKEDLGNINTNTNKNDMSKGFVTLKLQTNGNRNAETKSVTDGNEKLTNDSFHEILSESHGKEKAESKTGPTTSISSLMDSLAGAEDGSEKPAINQSRGASNEAKPVNEEDNTNTSNGIIANSNSSNVVLSENKQNRTEFPGVQSTEGHNQTNTTASKMNVTSSVTPTSSKIEGEPTNQDSKVAKFVLMSSHTTEQKIVRINKVPLTSQVENATTVQEKNVTSNNTKSGATSGSKRFQLDEERRQEQVVTTIDRQLETLKRLQEAKRARKRYDKAKYELQDKIKKLYDMAVSFEKPINAALVSTKTNIDPNPSTDNHPGAALAGISDKLAKVIKTPSDDSEHHGFTLGVMDSNALGKAHIVDLNEEKEKPVQTMYQIGLGENSATSETKSANGDQALKSLTEAIKNDLKKIELNQIEQTQAKKHTDDIKQVLGPLISEVSKGKETVEAVKDTGKANEKSPAKTAPETVLQAIGEKKDQETIASSDGKDEAAAKAQDAFKEVEDYLSKALKHVAKEAISEDDSSNKEAEMKENSGIVKEDSQESGKSLRPQSPTERVQVTNPTSAKESVDQKANGKKSADTEKDTNEKKETTKEKEQEQEKGKEQGKEQDKEKEKNERLRKIVEDAMKEHAKDPKNPHPVNADLLKPTSKVNEGAKVNQPADSNKKDEKNPGDQKSNPTAAVSAAAPTVNDGTIQRSPNDAIGKAEHLEEQVAQLQDKLYSQHPSSQNNDAYKTIDNVEDKPLFSQDANPGEQQPVYQDHVHHHSHRRHHRPYEDEEEDEGENGYYRDGNDRGYDNDDDDDDYDDEDGHDDYDDDDDEEDSRRKKSFLQPYSWRQLQYRNYQRDKIYNRQISPSPAVQKPLMNEGMMGNEVRDELEDMKKSTVPRLAAMTRSRGNVPKRNKMYIL